MQKWKSFPECVRNYVTCADALLKCLRANTKPPHNFVSFLAFGILRLDDTVFDVVVEDCVSVEFLERITRHMIRRKADWKLMMVMLGNCTSRCSKMFSARVLTTPDLIAEILIPFVYGGTSESKITTATGHSTQDVATWIVANLAQKQVSQDSKIELQKLVPALKSRVTGSAKITHGFMLSFRALCALLPASDPALASKSIRQRAIPRLLSEYKHALNGAPIPQTNFYPDPDDRALTVWYLSREEEGRTMLVEAGAVDLLTQSLKAKLIDGDASSLRLWIYATRALYEIASTHDHREALWKNEQTIDGLLAIAQREVVPFEVRRLAAGCLVVLRVKWEVERLLWLALKKRQKNCAISVLPHYIIQSIMFWLVIVDSRVEVFHEARSQIVHFYKELHKNRQ